MKKKYYRFKYIIQKKNKVIYVQLLKPNENYN